MFSSKENSKEDSKKSSKEDVLKNIHDPTHSLPPKSVIYSPLRSIHFAISGTILGFKREPNLTIQTLIGLTATLILSLGQLYLLALINLILMFFTLSSEFFNTSIEFVCDLVHPDFSLKVKHIKDLAAAGVWMISLGWLLFLLYCCYTLFIKLFFI